MANIAKNLFKIILGLVLIIIPIYAALTWGNWGAATIQFIKGGIIIFVVVIGLLFVILGFSELK